MTYNKNGNIITLVHTGKDGKSNTNEYTYKNQRLISKKSFGNDNISKMLGPIEIKFIYDKQGLVTEIDSYDNAIKSRCQSFVYEFY